MQRREEWHVGNVRNGLAAEFGENNKCRYLIRIVIFKWPKSKFKKKMLNFVTIYKASFPVAWHDIDEEHQCSTIPF